MVSLGVVGGGHGSECFLVAIAAIVAIVAIAAIGAIVAIVAIVAIPSLRFVVPFCVLRGGIARILRQGKAATKPRLRETQGRGLYHLRSQNRYQKSLVVYS